MFDVSWYAYNSIDGNVINTILYEGVKSSNDRHMMARENQIMGKKKAKIKMRK